jgi:hypothetical protein
LNQDNWTGIDYSSVIQPNHVEAVIARLNGKVWKYTEYSDEIGTDSEAKWHLFRAKRQSEKSERSDAGNLFIA